jgi:hypothetical protein
VGLLDRCDPVLLETFLGKLHPFDNTATKGHDRMNSGGLIASFDTRIVYA